MSKEVKKFKRVVSGDFFNIFTFGSMLYILIIGVSVSSNFILYGFDGVINYFIQYSRSDIFGFQTGFMLAVSLFGLLWITALLIALKNYSTQKSSYPDRELRTQRAIACAVLCRIL